MTNERRAGWIPSPGVSVAILVAILALLALLVFQGEESESRLPSARIVSSTAEGSMVLLEGGTPRTQAKMNYLPESRRRREQVLANLRNFRARYKQSRPAFAVSVTGTADSLAPLARRIASTLTQYDLGKLEPTADSPPDTVQDHQMPVLRCAPRDELIARQLLAALEPYLQGAVKIVHVPGLRLDRMQLLLNGKPHYSDAGEALFTPNGD